MEKPGDGTAASQHLENFFAHRRIVAAQHSGTARLQKINVSISVRIPQISVIRFLDGDREGIVEREIVLYAAGNELPGFVCQFFRAFALVIEKAQELLHLLAPYRAQRLADEVIQLFVYFVRIVIFTDRILLFVHFILRSRLPLPFQFSFDPCAVLQMPLRAPPMGSC